jgi:transcriptional regulator with XRE-family HTH domain
VTHLITVHSTKAHRAQRFGKALDRAMQSKDVGTRPVAEALGASRTSVMYWRTGRILPRLETAHRLAAALDAPILVKLAIDLRTKVCPIDDVRFVDDTGSDNRTYCSSSCQRVSQKQRVGRPIRETAVRFERALRRHRDAVAAFCNGCEPEGRCTTADCTLRPVSPLPLVDAGPVAEAVTSKRNGYSDPDRRQRDSQRQARLWSTLTPEERAARIANAAAASRRARGLAVEVVA